MVYWYKQKYYKFLRPIFGFFRLNLKQPNKTKMKCTKFIIFWGNIFIFWVGTQNLEIVSFFWVCTQKMKIFSNSEFENVFIFWEGTQNFEIFSVSEYLLRKRKYFQILSTYSENENIFKFWVHTQKMKIFSAVFSFFWRVNIYRFQNNGWIWLKLVKNVEADTGFARNRSKPVEKFIIYLLISFVIY